MGTAKDACDSIKEIWGRSTNMHQLHTQEALNQTEYAKRTDIQEHIKLMRTHKAAVTNLSTQAMLDETWRGIIICSIPPTTKWLPVIPSLYSMTTSADIISTLLAHGIILGRGSTMRTPNTVLAAWTTKGCTNANCKAKKHSTHTTSNCYWPGDGKEGQFPPNFDQQTRVNTTTSTTTTNNPPTPVLTNSMSSGQTDHLVLLVQVSTTPGQSGVLINIPTEYPHVVLNFILPHLVRVDSARTPGCLRGVLA